MLPRGDAVALAGGLVAEDAAGDGDVERVDVPEQRQREDAVGAFAHEAADAGAFRAEDQRERAGEVRGGPAFAVHVGGVDPDAEAFEFFEERGDIGDARHGDIFNGPGGGPRHGRGEAHRAAARDNDAVRAAAVCGAQDGPEVVRVLNASATSKNGGSPLSWARRKISSTSQ